MPLQTRTCSRCGAVVGGTPPAPGQACGCAEVPANVCSEGGGCRAEGDDKTPPPSGRLDDLAYQQELARVDGEWQTERERFLVRGPGGRRRIPTVGRGTLTGVALAGFGVTFATLAASLGAPLVFALVGGTFLLVGAGNAANSVRRARAYQHAFRAYRRRRAGVRPTRFCEAPENRR